MKGRVFRHFSSSLFNALEMISKTTSLLSLSINKLGYDSNGGSAISKSGIGLGLFSI